VCFDRKGNKSKKRSKGLTPSLGYPGNAFLSECTLLKDDVGGKQFSASTKTERRFGDHPTACFLAESCWKAWWVVRGSTGDVMRKIFINVCR
jgi:hypothetical protein